VLAVPIARAASVDTADGMRVTGQCRSGQPQGNYALREAGGRLRVQGAFSHGQRTGSFIFWSADGERVAHLPFEADRLNGTVSLWHRAKAAEDELPRRLEAVFRGGRRHGTTRGWHPNGRLHESAEYADGLLVSVQAWDEAGAPLIDARARTEAEAARAAEDREIEALLATVRRHLPDCAPPPVRQQARAAGRHPVVGGAAPALAVRGGGAAA